MSKDSEEVDWDAVMARYEGRTIILSALARMNERTRAKHISVGKYTTWKEMLDAGMPDCRVDEFWKESHSMQEVLREVMQRMDPSLEGVVRTALEEHWANANGAALLHNDERAQLSFF